VPAAFDDWFRVACARDPRDRFADVQTAALALAAALDPVAVPLAAGEPDPHEGSSDGAAQRSAGEAPEAPAEVPPLESVLDVVPTLASAAYVGPAPAPRVSWDEEEAVLLRDVSPLASTLDSTPLPAAPPVPLSLKRDGGRSSSPLSRRERREGRVRSPGDDAAPRFGLARTAMGALAAAALALTFAIHDAPRPMAGKDLRIVAARIPADRPPTSATHPASASFSLAEPTALGGEPVAPAAAHPQVASYPEPTEPALVSSTPPDEPSIDEGDSLLASLQPPETAVGVPPEQPSVPPSPSSGPSGPAPRHNVRTRASTARSSAFKLGPLGL